VRTTTEGTRRLGRYVGALITAGVVAVVLVIGLVLWFVTAPDPSLARWDPAQAEVSDDGSTVEVFFTGGQCDDHSEARVDESATTVEITVVTTEKRVRGCDDVGVPRSVVAELDEPLGSRNLVDGACNHPDWGRTYRCG
jgi:hypothetical protein